MNTCVVWKICDLLLSRTRYIVYICKSGNSAVFTTLHEMPARSSHEKAVCLSVCLSVRPFVCLSNRCIVTKRKKDLSRFLYRRKDHLAYFSEKNGWWGRPLLPEILGQADPVGAKSPIFNRYSLVPPQQ